MSIVGTDISTVFRFWNQRQCSCYLVPDPEMAIDFKTFVMKHLRLTLQKNDFDHKTPLCVVETVDS